MARPSMSPCYLFKHEDPETQWFVSLEEAAEYLKCSPDLVSQHMSSGEPLYSGWIVRTMPGRSPLEDDIFALLFQEEFMSWFTGDQVVRTIPDSVCVYDVIQAVSGGKYPGKKWKRLSDQYVDFGAGSVCYYRFPGGRSTPVASLSTAIQIISCLPGKRAAAFRQKHRLGFLRMLWSTRKVGMFYYRLALEG